MNRIMLLAAGVLASVTFAGCATNGTAPQQTPAQIAAVVCPAVQAELQTLSIAGVFTGGAATTLASQITPDVNAVCSVGATVTSANLQTLVNATIPVVATVIGNAPMTPQDKAIALLALGGAQTIYNMAMGLVDTNNVSASVKAAAVAAAK